MTFFRWTIVATERLVAIDVQAARFEQRIAHLEERLQERTEEAAKWEARASSFIDQVALGSGILSAPSMTPTASDTAEQGPVRQVMAALGRTELPRKKHSEAVPSPAPSLIGVNERAAREAISAVLDPSRK